MRFKNYLIEKGPSQKFAFLAVKEILTTGLHGSKVIITKKDKEIKIKMPDTARSSISKGKTGMEFTVDVEATN